MTLDEIAERTARSILEHPCRLMEHAEFHRARVECGPACVADAIRIALQLAVKYERDACAALADPAKHQYPTIGSVKRAISARDQTGAAP